MEQNCPCCRKHCPVEHLSCPTGRQHFGIKDTENSNSAGHSAVNEDKGIMLLRKCGHFLHHNIQNGGNSAALLDCLTPEERATLEALLEKCLENWQRI